MGDSLEIPVVLFPRNIIKYSIDDTDSKNLKCEDVIFSCLEKFLQSILLTQNPHGEEELTNLLPAFGLVKAENEAIWLTPSHVFGRENEKQVYKIRMRHRPPTSNIFIENTLLSEFFVLQALDDFLFGSLGKSLKISREVFIQLTTIALLFPLPRHSEPLDNSKVIDETYTIEKFKVHNYHKRFSKEIYNQLITTKNKMNRCIDHYYYYSAFTNKFNNYKAAKKTLLEYKMVFLQLLLENHPHYCFEKYSASVIDNEGHLRKANLFLNVYSESIDQMAGIYIDEGLLNSVTFDEQHTFDVFDVSSGNMTGYETYLRYYQAVFDNSLTRVCGLEDINQVNLRERAQGEWEVEIFINSSTPMALFFEEEEMATSFITFLQGHLTLCVQPDISVCRQLYGQSVKDRIVLKSFCPMSHIQARQTLENENFQKGENDKCGFLIYQSQMKLHDFYLATAIDEQVYVITCQDGKSVTMSGSDNNIVRFKHVSDLRVKLNKFGRQLFARRVAQSIDPQSVFYIHKPVVIYREPDEVNDQHSRPPAFILEKDLKPQKRLFKNSDKDSHLKRHVVEVGEERRLQVELIPVKSCYMEALHNAVVTMAELSRVHPSMIMSCFGPVLTPKPPMSFLFEYSDFSDLISFLKRGENTFSCQSKMRFALEVVKILCALTQPCGTSSSKLCHGNLKGHNFWVFRWRTVMDNKYYLKLGEPGLVHHYNSLELKDPDNVRRLPWLSPERRDNLSLVTEASEVYAAATTIAEIFHGHDNFESVIGDDGGMGLENFFLNEGNQIPLPEFPESDDKAVMESVKDVTRSLWKELSKCWNPDPEQRPSPSGLKEEISGLLEETKAIPQETVLGDLRVQLSEMYQVSTNDYSMDQCHLLIRSRSDFFVDPQKIIIDVKKPLGKGNFGSVYQGILVNDTIVAVKKPHLSTTTTPELLWEIDLCASLNHANIVTFLHFTVKDGATLIIMEFMNFGKLEDYAKHFGDLLTADGPQRVQQIKVLLNISLNVAQGMAYLESNNVSHCDLAARNVLLCRSSKSDPIIAKVADFGLAKAIRRGKDYYYVKMPAKPISWYPPEYLLVERYGNKSEGINFTTTGDIWSYGTTLWEIFTKGNNPRKLAETLMSKDGNTDMEGWLCEFFLTKQKRWPKEEYIDQDIYDLMMECWVEDPAQRPKFVELQEKLKILLDKREDV